MIVNHADVLTQQAREELASYEPWGRAGGGAPNPHGIRFTDLRAKGIYPEDELKVIHINNTNAKVSVIVSYCFTQRATRDNIFDLH